MSKLEELLQGVDVEWKAINDIIKVITAPCKVKKEIYKPIGKTPIIDQGKEYIAGYTDENFETVIADEYILFGDHSEHIKYVNFSFIQGADGLKILKIKKDFPKYIYYCFLNFYNKEYSYKRHWTNAKNTLIPIPCPDNPEKSLEIQQEIVRVLDELTTLTNQLTTELETERQNRKKQFEFFREQLFRFEEGENNYVALGELAENLDSKRKPITSSQRKPGKIPYYGASGIVDYVEDYIFDGDYLLVSEDGANLLARSTPIAFSISGKNWVNNHAHILKFETKYERLFVEYYLNSIDLAPYITGAAQPKLNKKNLNSIKIPNPALEEKERIVKLLDQLDATHTAIEEEITKEIKLRTQQYEYYREKLLSFPSLRTT